MEGVTINSVQESGANGGGKPMISVELSATKIAYLYIVQGESGQVVERFSFGALLMAGKDTIFTEAGTGTIAPFFRTICWGSATKYFVAGCWACNNPEPVHAII